MTANQDLFSGGVRQLLRFVVTNKTKAEVDDLVNKGPTTYKEVLASVAKLPTNFTSSGMVVQLPSAFELVSVRRLNDTAAQVEVAVKLASESHGALVQDFINRSPNFTQWASKTWAIAKEMKPNRAVMVTQRIDAIFTPGMADKNSTAFATFRDKYLPAFKAIIQARVPEVTDVVLLGLSAGSVVADTAILVNGSGSTNTTNTITATANSTTTVGNMTAQTTATNSNSTYIAPSDTVNSVAPQTTAGANTTIAPNTTTIAPNATTIAPNATTIAPNATTIAHANATTVPANSTVAPANSTVAPANTTSISPANTTTIAPVNSTGAPANTTTISPANTTTIAPVNSTGAHANTTTVAPASNSTALVTTTVAHANTTTVAPASNSTASVTTTAPGATTTSPVVTGTSTGTTTAPGTGTNTGSASGSSGTTVSSSVIQTNGLFLKPGTATTDLDVTRPDTRVVLRYTKTVSAANMAFFLDETSTNYKDEASMVSQMPRTFDAFNLTEPFSLKMSRQQSDTAVEFECSAKAATVAQVDTVIANFTNTAPYSNLPNKKWSLGRDMIQNRVVPLATSLNKAFIPQYLNHSSAEFTALKNSFLPSLLQQLQAKEPKVEKLMILSVSRGSTVVETAVLVNSSGNAASTTAITSAAASITSVGGDNATNLAASGNTQTYVTASDTINSVNTPLSTTPAPASTTTGVTVNSLLDDKVGGITTSNPRTVSVAATSNRHFMNVTVPSFIGLMILIGIFLFCTVSSNSCLCKMCSSNVKKDVV